MSLYDLLACPKCRVHLIREETRLTCTRCGQAYPIVRGTPILLPGGEVPAIEHDAECVTQSTYYPWIHRLIMQSLMDDQRVLYLGSGNMALSDPCVIRMDLKWTPHVDVVADAHALPFLPGSMDYIFSSAVVEHLRQPFTAAQSIWDTLKDGGYIYHDCNFVFAYHGYPHHYFNATLQGLEQVFGRFRLVRSGVAPFQMPSFALGMVIASYLQHTKAHQTEDGRAWVARLNGLLASNSMWFDRYFDEAGALHVAAGTYVSGLKQERPDDTVLPAPVMTHWRSDADLQRRFPDPCDLTRVPNLMMWAREEGRARHPEIDAAFRNLVPFNKGGPGAPWDRTYIRSQPFVNPDFGVHPDAKPPTATELQALREGPAARLVSALERALKAVRRRWS